jgi:hypothetical protein
MVVDTSNQLFKNLAYLILDKCDLPDRTSYKVLDFPGWDIQSYIELSDDDAATFHSIMMTSNYVIPAEFTHLGHKKDHDFAGYCSTLTLFIAEFLCICNIEKIAGSPYEQSYYMLHCTNPCLLYNDVRMWVRNAEVLWLKVSNKKGGGSENGSIKPVYEIDDTYQEAIDEIQEIFQEQIREISSQANKS